MIRWSTRIGSIYRRCRAATCRRNSYVTNDEGWVRTKPTTKLLFYRSPILAKLRAILGSYSNSFAAQPAILCTLSASFLESRFSRAGGSRQRRCNHQYCSGCFRIGASRQSLYHCVKLCTSTICGETTDGSVTPQIPNSNRIGRFKRRL